MISPKNYILSFMLLRTCVVKPKCKKILGFIFIFYCFDFEWDFSNNNEVFWHEIESWPLKNILILYQNALPNFIIGEIQDQSPEKVSTGLMWRVQQKNTNWIVALLNYALTVSIWFQVRGLHSVSSSTTQEEVKNTHTISWEKENWNQF